ncbi:MAG: hypothetical protein ACMVP2_03000 [Imperialibacter sp.]|uniref:hypothetical protein n=1 Tax=Imperialibacter sp. TaxID=2038411 RepID=UPI003A8B4E49
MRKSCVSTATIILFFSLAVSAQKLKYKDIFPLMQASKWDEAEQQLDLFIADPKNSEEANAHYSLGKILERKALSENIVTDTAQMFVHIDAADLHYNKSLKLIDEKELKKNEEYYQEFNRRDLRTGEFGIKVSDVHLDIENKVKSLQDRRNNVRAFLKEASVANKLYDEAQDILQNFKIDFSDQSSFLLGMDKEVEQEFVKLEGIVKNLESSVANTEASLAKIPSPGLAHTLTKKTLYDLADFSKGSLDLTREGNIEYWDLKAWIEMTKSEQKSNIGPFRQELIAYDRDLVAKKQAFVQNPSSVSGPFEFDPTILAKVRGFGANTLTEKVVSFKVEELNYLIEKQPNVMPDSAKVDDLYMTVSNLVGRLDKMKGFIAIDKQKAEGGFQRNPVFFTSRYVSPDQLLSYANERESFVDAELSVWRKKAEDLKKRRSWLIAQNGDSIALVVKDSIASPTGFSTIHIADSAGLYVNGLKLVGKDLNFVVAKATPAYTVEWMLNEKLPTPNKDFSFKPKNAGHAPTADGFRTFYIHYPLKEKTHLFITTVDNAGKALWKASLDLDHPPVSVSFNKMVMETIIYLEKPAGDPTADLAYIVIDRTGKVRK